MNVLFLWLKYVASEFGTKYFSLLCQSAFLKIAPLRFLQTECIQSVNNPKAIKNFEETNSSFDRKIDRNSGADFRCTGYVNMHNCYRGDKKSPRVLHGRSLHAKRVTICYDFWAGVVIDSYVWNGTTEFLWQLVKRIIRYLYVFFWPLTNKWT